MRLSRRVLLGVVAAGLFPAACLSPTLPLPPPSRPEQIERVSEGQYRATGAIPEPGTVLILNPRTKRVSGQLTELRYSITFEANPGDALFLWYETSTESSDYVAFEIDGEVTPAPDAGKPPGDSGTD